MISRTAFRRFISGLCLGMSALILSGQNLVLNPGWETFSFCPSGSGLITWTPPWQSSRQTPDVYNACTYNPQNTIPSNILGFQNAHSGTGMGGAICCGSFLTSGYLPDFREFIYGHLSSPLVAGTTYYVSFYLNLTDTSRFASDNQGILFVNGYGNPWPVPNSAHVYSTTVHTNKAGWDFVQGSFTPSINYSNFILGNLFLDGLSDIDTVANTGNWFLGYYYFDDICVSTNPLDCNVSILPVAWEAFEVRPEDGRTVQLAWTTAMEKSTREFQVERSLNGIEFEAIGKVPAAGNSEKSNVYGHSDRPLAFGQPVYYRIRLIDQDGNTHTSKVEEVILSGEDEQYFVASPNPVRVGNTLSIHLESRLDGFCELSLVDVSGREVRKVEFSNSGGGVQTFETTGLRPGIYQLVLKNGGVVRSTTVGVLK